MNGETEEQRRAAQRLQARLGVRYKIGKEISSSTSVDLSEKGVFIHTGNPAPEGTEVFMEINLGPGEPTIKAVGIVRRSIVPGDGSPGMGVEFQALYGIDQKALLRFMKVSIGREISEDDFGSAGDGDMLKFVFEPEGEEEGMGLAPESEPFVVEMGSEQMRSVHETYSAQVPNRVGPANVARSAKQRAKEAAEEVRYRLQRRDERYLAELRRLEESHKRDSLRMWTRLILTLTAIGVATAWIVTDRGARDYIKGVVNALLGMG